MTVDINPSVAVTYNWFSRVLSVEALNPEAAPLVSGLEDLRLQPVSVAVEEIVSAASETGLLAPAQANVVFIAVADRTDPRRADALVKSLAAEVPPLAGSSETVVITGGAEDYRRVRESHESQIPELIRKHLDEPDESTDAVHSDKPLKEILKNQQEQRQKNRPSAPGQETGPDRNPSAPDKDKGPKDDPKDSREDREPLKSPRTGPRSRTPAPRIPTRTTETGSPTAPRVMKRPPATAPQTRMNPTAVNRTDGPTKK